MQTDKLILPPLWQNRAGGLRLLDGRTVRVKAEEESVWFKSLAGNNTGSGQIRLHGVLAFSIEQEARTMVPDR